MGHTNDNEQQQSEMSYAPCKKKPHFDCFSRPTKTAFVLISHCHPGATAIDHKHRENTFRVFQHLQSVLLCGQANKEPVLEASMSLSGPSKLSNSRIAWVKDTSKDLHWHLLEVKSIKSNTESLQFQARSPLKQWQSLCGRAQNCAMSYSPIGGHLFGISHKSHRPNCLFPLLSISKT